MRTTFGCVGSWICFSVVVLFRELKVVSALKTNVLFIQYLFKPADWKILQSLRLMEFIRSLGKTSWPNSKTK